jgi:hypothetical protein
MPRDKKDNEDRRKQVDAGKVHFLERPPGCSAVHSGVGIGASGLSSSLDARHDFLG